MRFPAVVLADLLEPEQGSAATMPIGSAGTQKQMRRHRQRRGGREGFRSFSTGQRRAREWMARGEEGQEAVS